MREGVGGEQIAELVVNARLGPHHEACDEHAADERQRGAGDERCGGARRERVDGA